MQLSICLAEEHHPLRVARFKVCVCVCVCVVSLAQGQVQAPLWQFSIWFSICLQPVHPAVIGYLAFAGVQIQGLSHETAMVQGASKAPGARLGTRRRIGLSSQQVAWPPKDPWLTVPA